MDRSDLTPVEWIEHYQQEMADGLQYAERWKGAAKLLQEAYEKIYAMSEKGDASANDWCLRYEEQFTTETK